MSERKEAWRIVGPDEPPGDPMIRAQCAAKVYGGKRRCRNRSAWLPASMLLNEFGEWFCVFHGGRS